MSSKAYYKASVVPQLIHRCQVGNRAVEAWTTTCIVTNFGKPSVANSSILINPANPELSGARNFSYFPRGGPVPKEKLASSMHKDWQPLGYVSNWGGMEVGRGMMYPVTVVDGLVHLYGGWRLEAECAWKRTIAIKRQVCPIGSAVVTSAGGEKLAREYDWIVHTTPPFYLQHDHDRHHHNNDNNTEPPEIFLRKCYQNAFQLAFNTKNGGVILRVASPLLGAGARGFPEDVATKVAAESARIWLHTSITDGMDGDDNEEGSRRQERGENSAVVQTVAFGLLEKQLADKLFEELLAC